MCYGYRHLFFLFRVKYTSPSLMLDCVYLTVMPGTTRQSARMQQCFIQIADKILNSQLPVTYMLYTINER